MKALGVPFLICALLSCGVCETGAVQPGVALPVGQTNVVVEGGPASLLAVANPTPPLLAVQWRRGGTNIPGATNLLLYFPIVSASDAGAYFIAATNANGSQEFGPAFLEVRARLPIDSWNWRHPRPQGSDLHGVAYGHGVYVVVGRAGAILVSSDAQSWTNRQAERFGYLRGVTFAEGRFAAVGDRGMVTSTNGWDWVNTGPVEPLTDINYGNGVWLANGAPIFAPAPEYFTSTNGVDWSRRRFPEGMLPNKIVFAEGKFVGTTGTNIVTSVNGVDWEARAVRGDVTPSWVMGHADGRYFGAGPGSVLMVSSNLVDWASYPEITSISAVGGANGRFLVATWFSQGPGYGLFTSTNGVNWTPREIVLTNQLLGITFAGNLFFGVGDDGVIMTSRDAANWTVAGGGTDLNFRGVARGPHGMVAVANAGNKYISRDGLTWESHPFETDRNIRNVAYLNNRYVALGADGVVFWSTNIVDWTAWVAAGDGLSSIIYTNNMYVAVGDDGNVVTSSDGERWTTHSTGFFNDRYDVTYGAGMYVAVGGMRTLLYSSNATQWAWAIYNGDLDPMEAVVYGKGRFIAVGGDGAILTSTNGLNWNSGFGGRITSQDLNEVLLVEDRFVAMGEQGTLISSEDGQTWVRHWSSTVNNLRAASYHDGVLTVVGNNENILQSNPSRPLFQSVAVQGGKVELMFAAEPAPTLRLQRSPDLSIWQDLGPVAGGDLNRVQVPESGAGRQFFRIRQHP